jgi:hypothetical protein
MLHRHAPSCTARLKFKVALQLFSDYNDLRNQPPSRLASDRA